MGTGASWSTKIQYTCRVNTSHAAGKHSALSRWSCARLVLWQKTWTSFYGNTNTNFRSWFWQHHKCDRSVFYSVIFSAYCVQFFSLRFFCLFFTSAHSKFTKLLGQEWCVSQDWRVVMGSWKNWDPFLIAKTAHETQFGMFVLQYKNTKKWPRRESRAKNMAVLCSSNFFRCECAFFFARLHKGQSYVFFSNSAHTYRNGERDSALYEVGSARVRNVQF